MAYRAHSHVGAVARAHTTKALDDMPELVDVRVPRE